jgi:hypothetical protein
LGRQEFRYSPRIHSPSFANTACCAGVDRAGILRRPVLRSSSNFVVHGWLDSNVVECPLHGGQFDVSTGKAVCSPAEVDIQTYAVRVTNGRIEVLLPEAERCFISCRRALPLAG